MLVSRKIEHFCRGRQYSPLAWRHKGSTLIEVLVALLLLSFTLLGIAGLLGATTRYQLGVDSRSKITLIYNDLTGRVRTNWTETAAYAYTASWSAQQAAIPARGTNCSGSTSCDPADRAADDVWETRSAVRTALPQGSLLITGDAANGLTTTFLWFDKDNLNPTADDPSALKQSNICEDIASPTSVQLHTCCPNAAGVGSTLGVRCLNFSFIR